VRRDTAGALPRPWADIENDVVGTGGISRHAAHSRQVIEPQTVSNPPRYEVVGAGSVPAQSDGGDQHPL